MCCNLRLLYQGEIFFSFQIRVKLSLGSGILTLLLTFGGMKRSGLRGCKPIPRYCPCQRELGLQIELKPLCFMTAC
jgi:hypothetical protein